MTATGRAPAERDEGQTRPPVTAVICTRDRPAMLPVALARLGPALQPCDELIVVESGDSGAASALAALETAASVILIPSARREKSHKLNLAIERATAPILVLTDDDVEVGDGWVDAMAREFVDSEVGVAFGPVLGLSTHGEGPLGAPPPGEAPLSTWLYAHGASMALRTTAVQEAGGFDERLGPGAPAHGEEHDLLLRLRERDWRAVIARAPTNTHLDWRDEGDHRANVLVYERGSGAFVGAALRRAPRRWARLAALRLRYQLLLVWRGEMGFASMRAFLGGLVYGMRMKPR